MFLSLFWLLRAGAGAGAGAGPAGPGLRVRQGPGVLRTVIRAACRGPAPVPFSVPVRSLRAGLPVLYGRCSGSAGALSLREPPARSPWRRHRLFLMTGPAPAVIPGGSNGSRAIRRAAPGSPLPAGRDTDAACPRTAAPRTTCPSAPPASPGTPPVRPGRRPAPPGPCLLAPGTARRFPCRSPAVSHPAVQRQAPPQARPNSGFPLPCPARPAAPVAGSGPGLSHWCPVSAVTRGELPLDEVSARTAGPADTFQPPGPAGHADAGQRHRRRTGLKAANPTPPGSPPRPVPDSGPPGPFPRRRPPCRCAACPGVSASGRCLAVRGPAGAPAGRPADVPVGSVTVVCAGGTAPAGAALRGAGDKGARRPEGRPCGRRWLPVLHRCITRPMQRCGPAAPGRGR